MLSAISETYFSSSERKLNHFALFFYAPRCWLTKNNEMLKTLFGFTCTATAVGVSFVHFDNSTAQKWDENWDKRDPKSLLSPKSAKQLLSESEREEKLKSLTGKGTRNLILIRHGQYNLGGVNDAAKGLTDMGRYQARETGKRLKLLNFPYKIIVSSTMQRALETTDFILESIPNVPHVHDDLLREGAPYPPEPPNHAWRPEAAFLQEGTRIEAAFRRYFHRAYPEQTEDSFEILVCHANVIRYFVCRALQFPPEGWLRMSICHCGITWVVIKPNGRVHIRSLGDSGHLLPHALTRN